MSLLDEMRAIAERVRLLTPWVEWARQHSVALLLSEWVPMDTGYVMPGLETEFAVVVHPELLRNVRRLLTEHGAGGRLTDQHIAELIAWHKADMPEPGDRS